MSRLDRLLYVRKQKNRERQTSFPPLERNPAWDEEDRQRRSRYPLKPEYDPLYQAPEPEPQPCGTAAGVPVVRRVCAQWGGGALGCAPDEPAPPLPQLQRSCHIR